MSSLSLIFLLASLIYYVDYCVVSGDDVDIELLYNNSSTVALG